MSARNREISYPLLFLQAAVLAQAAAFFVHTRRL